MPDLSVAGTFTLGDRTVSRVGYGAMQLAGPGVFNPPRDRDDAIAVLRAAVEAGVDHIDTSDLYGPHVTNQLIREALHPYPDDLTIVTKIGAVRGDDASWKPAITPAQLEAAVHDNLRNLELDVLDVVKLRLMGDGHGPSEGSLEEPLTAVAELQAKGLIRHIGLSTVTPTQVAEGGASPTSYASRTNIIWRAATTIRWSTGSPLTTSPMSPISRLAASRRCSRTRCRMSPIGSARQLRRRRPASPRRADRRA